MKIIVAPTDTVYGILTPALDKKAVEEVYKIRKRNPKRPCIILVSSIKDLQKFKVTVSTAASLFLNKLWPGKVSVVLPCTDKKFTYLHRGTKTLAFRMPKPKAVLKLLKKHGPMIAPSANPEGLPTAKTVSQAKKYFGDQVEYVPGRRLDGKPSTLIKLEDDGRVTILRKGVVKITQKKYK